VNFTRGLLKLITPIWRKLTQDQRQRLLIFITNSKNLQNLGLWISAITAGFISVGYAFVFRMAEAQFRNLLNSHYSHWIFALCPLLFLAAWYLVRRFSPEAAGSGIPQIMAANEMDYRGAAQVRIDQMLSPKTALVKVASSLLCILGGGAIGREGPTIQISTSVFHFFGKKVRRFVPETAEQTWIVAGAAAGLASAFNTPLGGIVYAIEELGVVHFHRIRTALVSAVIVSGLVAQWMLGGYLYLGYPQLQTIELSFLPIAILVGLITGLLGGFFGQLLFVALKHRSKFTELRVLAGITVVCGVLMAALISLTPHAAGTGVEVITGFLFRGQMSSPYLVLARYFGTMISYLSGAAGGIFSPSLAIGATIGAWLTELFHTQHPNLMVLLGMIGFLTGVTRTPFTSFILVLEMTDRHSAIFPMMLVALIAQWMAHLTDDHSFYEHVKKLWLVEPSPSTTSGQPS
jgi:H+/Cl- antiporter ClcA